MKRWKSAESELVEILGAGRGLGVGVGGVVRAVGLGVEVVVPVVREDDALFGEQALGRVGVHDVAHGRRLLDVLAGDGQRHDVEGRVVVHLAHGGEEDGEERQQDDDDGIRELLDAEVAHHRELPDEQRRQNARVDVRPHPTPALKLRHVHLQRLHHI